MFAPDGGFEEGPSYWNYATAYNVMYIAALTSALGTDFGMADAPGFSATPDYQFQSIGPTLKFANFGDAVEDVFPSPQVFWFARRFRRPAYAAQERLLINNPSLNPHVQRESSRFSMLGLMVGRVAARSRRCRSASSRRRFLACRPGLPSHRMGRPQRLVYRFQRRRCSRLPRPPRPRQLRYGCGGPTLGERSKPRQLQSARLLRTHRLYLLTAKVRKATIRLRSTARTKTSTRSRRSPRPARMATLSTPSPTSIRHTRVG